MTMTPDRREGIATWAMTVADDVKVAARMLKVRYTPESHERLLRSLSTLGIVARALEDDLAAQSVLELKPPQSA